MIASNKNGCAASSFKPPDSFSRSKDGSESEENITHNFVSNFKKGIFQKKSDIITFLCQLNAGWEIINYHHLEKEFIFENFNDVINFANQVFELSLIQNHYPTIHLSFCKIKILIWTDKNMGLTENDFILASKIEELNY